MSAPVILARGLEKAYGPVHAVRGLDFEVAPARCVGLLGPNGAGKTTVMRMIMGLTRPSAGELRVFGMPVAQLTRAAQGAGRPGAAGKQPRPRPVGTPESRSVRTLFQPAIRPARRAHPGVARLHATRRTSRERGQSTVRRHEAAPRARARPDQQSGARDPGRADHGARPAGAGDDLEAAARSQTAGADAAVDHPLHGRSAAPVRPDHRHRSRPYPRSQGGRGI